jgi:hypothetical protein
MHRAVATATGMAQGVFDITSETSRRRTSIRRMVPYAWAM